MMLLFGMFPSNVRWNKGPDASKFTQLLTPRNLSNCEINQCKYVLNTNYQGGILSDPILLRLAEDHWWYSISDSDLYLGNGCCR